MKTAVFEYALILLVVCLLLSIFSPISAMNIGSSAENRNTISLNFNFFDKLGINKISDRNYPGYWLFLIQNINEYGLSDISVSFNNETNVPILCKEIYSFYNPIILNFEDNKSENFSGYLFYTTKNIKEDAFGYIFGKLTLYITGDVWGHIKAPFIWNGADYPFDQYSIDLRIIFFTNDSHDVVIFPEWEHASGLKIEKTAYKLSNSFFSQAKIYTIDDSYATSYEAKGITISRPDIEQNIVSIFLWLMVIIYIFLFFKIIEGEDLNILLTIYLGYFTPALFVFAWLINQDPMIDSFVIIFGVLILSSTLFLLIKGKLTSLYDKTYVKTISVILGSFSPIILFLFAVGFHQNLIPYFQGFLFNTFSYIMYTFLALILICYYLLKKYE